MEQAWKRPPFRHVLCTCTTVLAKAVMMLLALGALDSTDAGLALALARIGIAHVRNGSCVAAVAPSAAGLNVAESVLALRAGSTDVLVLADALAALLVALMAHRSELVALTCFKARRPEE